MFRPTPPFPRPILPTLALALALAAACGDSTGPDPDSLAKKEAVKMVPFRGNLIGYTFAITPAPAECVAPQNRRTGFEFVGNASHLGYTTVYAEHCNSSAGDAVGGGKMVAPNGDELHFTHTVPLAPIVILKPPPLPVVVQFDVLLVITGGTGRFTDATGSAKMVCVRTTPISNADYPPHTPAYNNFAECAFNGEISSVGSGE